MTRVSLLARATSFPPLSRSMSVKPGRSDYRGDNFIDSVECGGGAGAGNAEAGLQAASALAKRRPRVPRPTRTPERTPSSAFKESDVSSRGKGYDVKLIRIERTTSRVCLPMEPVEPSTARPFSFAQNAPRHKKIVIKSRHSEDETVKPVENSAVPRYERARILDPRVPFNHGFDKVAEHGYYSENNGKRHALDYAESQRKNFSKDKRGYNPADYPAGRALYGFLGAYYRRERTASDEASGKIRAGIVCPDYDKGQKRSQCRPFPS